MICVINYGSGNIAALTNIFKQWKIPHFVSGDPAKLCGGDRFLLPGVGAFDPTMEQLTRSGIVEALSEQVLAKGKPLLGICVGMHLLAEASDEGDLAGLGWVKGRVRQIDPATLGAPPHLPHMGWNAVRTKAGAGLFDGVDRGARLLLFAQLLFRRGGPRNRVGSCRLWRTFAMRSRKWPRVRHAVPSGKKPR